MMSLFGNLFSSAGDSSGLFAEGSKFKAQDDSKRPEEESEQAPEQTEPTTKRSKHKRAAEAGPSDVKADTADAAALKLQAGIAAAQAVQDAADGEQTQLENGKRRKRDKQEKRSTKAHKSLANSSPAAANQQQSIQQEPPHQNKQDEDKQQLYSSKKKAEHKRSKVSQADLAAAPVQPVASTEADAEQPDTAAAAQPDKQKLTPEEQAEKLSRTIFVGNLPITVKRKQLNRLFSQYGEVDSVRLRSVPLDLESKKKLPRKAAVIKGVVSSDRGGTNAYVVFKEQAAVAAALAANMTEVDGHHIRVDRAAAPSAAAAEGAAVGSSSSSSSSVLYDPVRSVFVGNLDFKITEEELIRTFSNGDAQPELAAAVEAVRVVRDPKTNLGKGIAYVLFKTKAAARSALQLDGQQLGKRAMRVSRVDRKASAAAASTKQKRDSSAAGGGAKRFRDKASQGRGLGVQQGGVQKRIGAGKPGSSAAAADWQGLRTKGKGSGFRSGSKIVRPSAGKAGPKSGVSAGRSPARGGKAAGPSKHGAKTGGKSGAKRPAVAARKEKAKAAAKRAKTGK